MICFLLPNSVLMIATSCRDEYGQMRTQLLHLQVRQSKGMRADAPTLPAAGALDLPLLLAVTAPIRPSSPSPPKTSALGPPVREK